MLKTFLFFQAYICYLKKYRGYRYENGQPDSAILRQSSECNRWIINNQLLKICQNYINSLLYSLLQDMASAGFKHFSAAGFRASQLSLSSSDRVKLAQTPGRPHTFPLSSNSTNLPKIRIEQVV